ncbi:MAG: putative DNA base hypermodification protein [Candidatus Thiodiazotropha lotti]|nr:hypothetical protein [Candidatus Thiodiazotropha lotti]MCW4219774.1 putative DNA base hypermodification protein [Candidatus Thiodiazotropha lotti]
MTEFSKYMPTEVFEAYWRFATERQRIFQMRATQQMCPWTADPILQTYKFTNTYRLLDRVSQFLIREVIGTSNADESDLFFRVILFKLFNKIETWKLLERELGPISWRDYDYDKYNTSLTNALHRGVRIYSAAYIMPSGLSSFGSKRKHRNHLKLLEMMMKDGLPTKINNCRSMKEGYDLLFSYPTIGSFLAYQLITDINYSDLTDFEENEFVVAGPGACEGVRKCFKRLNGVTPEEIIQLIATNQDKEFDRRGLVFDKIAGRPLQYIDCQNLFCEIDKYSRVAFPDIRGASRRTRIKQKFKPNTSPIQYMFPTKWGGAFTVHVKEYA